MSLSWNRSRVRLRSFSSSKILATKQIIRTYTIKAKRCWTKRSNPIGKFTPLSMRPTLKTKFSNNKSWNCKSNSIRLKMLKKRQQKSSRLVIRKIRLLRFRTRNSRPSLAILIYRSRRYKKKSEKITNWRQTTREQPWNSSMFLDQRLTLINMRSWVTHQFLKNFGRTKRILVGPY